MYLPEEIPNAKVLITVKTYPLPSNKYDELVCTAGFLESGEWIRLYPIPFGALASTSRYEKYHWVTVDLTKTSNDIRPESYRPKYGAEKIIVGEKIDTDNNWAHRKTYALREVFTSMKDLIALAKGPGRKSLATLKPKEIIDLVIEDSESEWKPKWQAQLGQFNLFDLDEQGRGKVRKVHPKIPYKFSYKFVADGDQRPRKLFIEDWELGALYNHCLHRSGGDKDVAKRQVKQKFFDEFCYKKDLYLFLGTTKHHHLRAPNPFIVVGVFYPPREKGEDGDGQNTKKSTLETKGIEQHKLFEDL